MFLPDINIWLALTFQSHKHHDAARDWLDSVGDDERCFFCRVSQHGFLRLSNNRLVVAEAVTQPEAWQLYDDFLADPRIEFLEEPAGFELVWRDFTQRPLHAPNTWSDAFLATLAKVSDFELVTLDQGFKQYSGVRVKILI